MVLPKLSAPRPSEGAGPSQRASPRRRGLLAMLVADLLLARDRPGDAVVHLEPLVHQTPYDEQRWALLVRALGAVGRNADALEAFQRARRALVDDLGLEPGHLLQSAEREVFLRPAPGPRPMR